MSRQGRTGERQRNNGAHGEHRPETLCTGASTGRCSARVACALSAVPGGISNFYNAFHGFAVQTLDWYLIDRELIAPFAQADFLLRAHMLNALVLPGPVPMRNS